MNLCCTPLENDLPLTIRGSCIGACFAPLLGMFLSVEECSGFSGYQARSMNNSCLAESHLFSSYYFQNSFPVF